MTDTKKDFVEGELFSARVVIVYAAWREAYDGSTVASYHLTRHEAVIGASGLGYSGPDGKVEKRIALRFSDGRLALVPELIQITEDPEAEAKLRAAALKKLSPAELAALMGQKK